MIEELASKYNLQQQQNDKSEIDNKILYFPWEILASTERAS